MTAVAVDILVVDRATLAPLQGVLVKVFSQSADQAIAENLSTTSGLASFLLDSGARYQVRASCSGVLFANPVYIDVDSTILSTFRIYGVKSTLPSSTNPRLCMCSGFLRHADGTPARGVVIHLTPRFRSLLLVSAGVVTETITATSDAAGWVQTSLIRFGEYDVLMEGFEDTARTISVPDSAACSLPDLLFEVVSSVSAPTSVQVPLGQTLELAPSVTTSVGRQLEGVAREDVRWTLDDTTIATMTVTWDKIILYGNQLGTTTLRAQRSDTSIVRIPDPPLHPGIQIQVV